MRDVVLLERFLEYCVISAVVVVSCCGGLILFKFRFRKILHGVCMFATLQDNRDLWHCCPHLPCHPPLSLLSWSPILLLPLAPASGLH